MSLELLKDRIRETPVSLIIGQLMPLSKKGSNIAGICPFHSDTKPSLVVNDSKGIFKCFACGAGGDAIKFVQDFKHLDFVDALKDIANILGLPFDEFQKEKKRNPRVEMAHRVLNASVKLYQKAASVHHDIFQAFLDSRRLNQESVENYQIGLSPAHNSLYQYLQKIPKEQRELATKVALDIGIVKFNSDRNSHYDFFRDRIMFPIHDHSGHVKGYSARAMRDGQNPKYLNSSESYAFDKGAILFGFYFAKTHIRSLDQVLIVEGNMDVIMMHQYGFKQTVGTMGTALSEHSVRLLGNMTKNVYLAMDTDAAGVKAAKRINAEFLSLAIIPKFLSFHPAKDPDEFLITHGQLELTKRIEQAPAYIDVIIDELLPKERSENLEHKLSVLHQVFELVAPLKEHLAATERVVNVAKSLGLKSDSQTILDDYKQYLSTQKEKVPTLAPRPTRLPEAEEEIQRQQEALDLQEASFVEEELPPTQKEAYFLKEIICHPEFLATINKNDFLATLRHHEVKKLFQWLVDIYSEIDDTEYVNIVRDQLQYGGYSQAINKIGIEALFHHGNRYNDKVIKQMLKDYLAGLKLDQLRSIRKELAQAQLKATTQVEIDSILGEIGKLDKEIMNLR